MERPNLSREELLQILHTNRPWMPISPGVSLESQIPREGPIAIFFDLMDRLVEVAVDRLQDPEATGPMLGMCVASKEFITLATNARLTDFSHLPFTIPASLNEAILRLNLIAACPIDFSITVKECWEEITAVVALATSYHVKPEAFLQNVPKAPDLILGMVHSPDSYREREQARFDARHPDVLRRYHDAVQREIQALRDFHPGLGTHPIRLNWTPPSEEDFWVARAEWMTAVEQRIDHVWPGQGLGGTRIFQEDA